MNPIQLGKSVFVLITELKNELREWCGMLSVEEIMSNPDLIQCFERFERALQKTLEFQKNSAEIAYSKS
jgi:hypothetical protein